MKSSFKNKKHYIIKRSRRDRRIVGGFFWIIIALFFMICIGRFVYIAVGGHVGQVNLTQRTQTKYRHETILPAQRGGIYANDGSKIAYSDKSYQIYAVLNHEYVSSQNKPLYVTDKVKTARILSRYISLSPAQILKILNPTNKKAFQVEFGSAGRNITLKVKKEIEAQHLTGIYFYSTQARSYPNGTFASNTIGLAQLSSDGKRHTLTGTMGLEQYFDQQLQGKSGLEVRSIDPQGYTLPSTHPQVKLPQQGNNIYTTLDPNYQYYLEQLMNQVSSRYQPQAMQAIITNPKTGNILALTQRPTFNPNDKVGLDKSWSDLNVQNSFEPGSVMKIMTLAAAIDSHNYNPQKYYRSGSVTVDDRQVRDWNTSGWGYIPLSQAFPRSSNVGMVYLEQTMGADTWLRYLKKFRITQPTGILLPGEVSGNLNFQHRSDQAITSFGQSIAVTGMQMVQAIGAFGNQGMMMQPRLVTKIVNPNTGKIRKFPVHEVDRPVKKSTVKAVIQAMRDVVQKDYGTGGAYKIEGQDIAVKTGTAQIASKVGGYLTGNNNYTYSVAGLAPAKDPQYLVYITMARPQKMTKAPEKILAEVFNPMMQRLLGTGTIKDETSSKQTLQMADVTGQSYKSVQDQLAHQGLNVGVIGTGQTIVQQLPTTKSKVIAGQRVVVLTNGVMTMPDVKGWSRNDLLKLAYLTGKKVEFVGHGYAVRQSIAAGAVLNSVKKIQIKLE
ncbi:penicillin-binding protein [Lactobacillus sp. DCY120]|uniref:Penicillin-binding protein n=1 Tax=Bombilactobacillus apium TaxID=2675299 RepID=A0A850QYD5_9LACO|nr:penicillin-binding protein [Bombilactobacillus apium]NVY95673.1 penicillin-binding protein [Bombilactobacillus apium]